MKRLIYSAIFLCVAILVANANEAVDSIAVKSHVNVIIGSKENEQDVENAFKENIPQDKSVAGMPHFAIVGKYKRFYLGIGANFKAFYDFGLYNLVNLAHIVGYNSVNKACLIAYALICHS